MELALPRDEDGLKFAKVRKRLRDATGLPIGTDYDNLLLDTRLYEAEYAADFKASVAANTIEIHMFYQVGNGGNVLVLFDEIIYHRTDGSEIQPKDGGRRRRECTKG